MANNGAYTLPFGRAIKYLLKQTGRTQKELAAALHVSEASVSGWLKLQTPEIEDFHLVNMAAFLGVTVGELETGNVPVPSLSKEDTFRALARQYNVRPDLLKDWIESLAVMPEKTQEIEVQGARVKTRLWRDQQKHRIQENKADYKVEASEG